MSDAAVYVLDASLGVKWFKPEAGRAEALALLERASSGEVRLVAPVHFAHEVLSVVRRHYAPVDVPDAWRRLQQAGVTLLPLSDEVVEEAARQCESLKCSFYDALAPACASLLSGTLATADRKAHGGYSRLYLVE